MRTWGTQPLTSGVRRSELTNGDLTNPCRRRPVALWSSDPHTWSMDKGDLPLLDLVSALHANIFDSSYLFQLQRFTSNWWTSDPDQQQEFDLELASTVLLAWLNAGWLELIAEVGAPHGVDVAQVEWADRATRQDGRMRLAENDARSLLTDLTNWGDSESPNALVQLSASAEGRRIDTNDWFVAVGAELTADIGSADITDARGLASAKEGAVRPTDREILRAGYSPSAVVDQLVPAFERALEDHEIFFAARAHGRIVGYARPRLPRADGDGREISGLYVVPAYRGTRIAQDLFEAAFGESNSEVWVPVDAFRAQSFFKRNGYSADPSAGNGEGMTKMIRSSIPS